MCFSKNFVVLYFTFRYLKHFELCIWYELGVQSHTFAYGHSVVLTFLFETIPLPLHSTAALVKNKLTVNEGLFLDSHIYSVDLCAHFV